jgi:hypothetical protein
MRTSPFIGSVLNKMFEWINSFFRARPSSFPSTTSRQKVELDRLLLWHQQNRNAPKDFRRWALRAGARVAAPAWILV